MTSSLTRLAQSALGKRGAAVMPILRPVFALPRSLPTETESTKDQAYNVERSARAVDIPRPSETSAKPAGTMASLTDLRLQSALDVHQGMQQEAASQRLDTTAREDARAPQRLTLRQVIDHLYPPADPREGGVTSTATTAESRTPSLVDSPNTQDETAQARSSNAETRATGIADPRLRPSLSRISFDQHSTADHNPIVHPPDQTAAPEVHVTIGNIELKAAQQPAPPLRAVPPARPPHMSLSEYLERRRGGRL